MSSIEGFTELGDLVRAGEMDWGQYGAVYAREWEDLLLFNYTNAAAYENNWNWLERVSRGLILDRKTGEVIARPFNKFFNWGEGGRTTNVNLVEMTEKLDGSLGILYRHEGQYRIATRGSFDGEQALWATDHLQKHYTLADLAPEATLLFEIIYPDNRVVVDYGDMEDLVLIGIRNRHNGYDFSSQAVKDTASFYGFPSPKSYQFDSIEEVLALAPTIDANQEGWVARFSNGERFKVKGDAYRELHRLIHLASFKRVLEAVRDGKIDEWIRAIPHELLDDITDWRNKIDQTVTLAQQRVAEAWGAAPQGGSRKDFALWVKAEHLQDAPYLFALLDGKDIESMFYRIEFKEVSDV